MDYFIIRGRGEREKREGAGVGVCECGCNGRASEGNKKDLKIEI